MGIKKNLANNFLLTLCQLCFWSLLKSMQT